MKQSEAEAKKEEKIQEKKKLIGSSQWTLQHKDSFGEVVDLAATAPKVEVVGFSEIFEPVGGSSNYGRREYGKPKKVEVC